MGDKCCELREGWADRSGTHIWAWMERRFATVVEARVGISGFGMAIYFCSFYSASCASMVAIRYPRSRFLFLLICETCLFSFFLRSHSSCMGDDILTLDMFPFCIYNPGCLRISVLLGSQGAHQHHALSA